MALKVLQVVGAVAVVLLTLLLIPVLIRLRRTLDEAGRIVADSRPQTLQLLRKAQNTLDSVNDELTSIDGITTETKLFVSRVGEASEAVERAVKSPLTKAGLVSAGAAATFIGVKRSLSRKASGKE